MLEAGRPLTFIHPIVRSGIYSELSAANAARATASPPDCWRSSRARTSGSSNTCSRATCRDHWVVERLAEAAHVARRQGAPDLEAVYLRRALEEPPRAEELPQLVLQLGIAEAGGGLEGWDEHLRRAIEVASTPRAAARAASALGRGLYRAQRFVEAVDASTVRRRYQRSTPHSLTSCRRPL